MTVSVDYYNILGTGRTIKEAKQQAGQVITATIQAVRKGPMVVRIRDQIVMVSPTVGGFGCCYVGTQNVLNSLFISGNDDFHTAVCRAINWCAQNAWNLKVNDSELLTEIDDIAYRASMNDRERDTLCNDLSRYFAWQRDYARLAATGLNDSEIREQLR